MSDPRSTLRAYFAAIRQRDVDAWLATFAKDAVDHDPPGGPPLRGHAALQAFFVGFLSNFVDLSLHEGEIFVVGREAAVSFTARGTRKDGKQVRFDGIDVFKLDESNKIVELKPYWHPADLDR